MMIMKRTRDWKAKYLSAKKAFVVRNLKLNGNTAEVKLQAAAQKGGTELRLALIGLDLFDDLFHGISLPTEMTSTHDVTPFHQGYILICATITPRVTF